MYHTVVFILCNIIIVINDCVQELGFLYHEKKMEIIKFRTESIAKYYPFN